jgi:hypothetical protein
MGEGSSYARFALTYPIMVTLKAFVALQSWLIGARIGAGRCPDLCVYPIAKSEGGTAGKYDFPTQLRPIGILEVIVLVGCMTTDLVASASLRRTHPTRCTGLDVPWMTRSTDAVPPVLPPLTASEPTPA